ncbi:MAG TPA: CBS domain-containing protein [Pyrinomonadaceae bacterium]|jgi:CBS domain-containing protein
MSAEQSAEQQKGRTLTPSDKTDKPKRARDDSVSLLETRDYVCVAPDAPLSEAIAQMKKDEGGCVIVCEQERVVGIFTERDLLQKVIGQDVDHSGPVRHWMSPVVETLGPEATIGDAVRVMNKKGYRNVPLVQYDRLIGSISVFDVITYLAESYPKETMNLPPVPAQVMDTQEGG